MRQRVVLDRAEESRHTIADDPAAECIERDGESFAHAAGPAADEHHNRPRVIFIRSAGQHLFDPLPTDTRLALFSREVVYLIGSWPGDEPTQQGSGDRGFAAAGRFAQIQY